MLDLPTTLSPNDAARFWSKVAVRSNGCMEWTSSKDGGNYGQFRLNGHLVKAHRLAYTLHRGPIPHGLTLDHRCRNHPCMNPWHFDAVTHRVNVLRGTAPQALNARKTHCRRGHELAGDNLQIIRGTERVCRACVKIRSDINNEKKRISK